MRCSGAVAAAHFSTCTGGAAGWWSSVRAACLNAHLVSQEGFAVRLLLEVLEDEASCYSLS